MPNFNPKMMMKGSTSAQRASRNARNISPADWRGGGAMFSERATNHQAAQSAAPIIRPGKMPAKNRREIDTLAATPKTTNPMLGGMNGAMIPAEAIRPAERALS